MNSTKTFTANRTEAIALAKHFLRMEHDVKRIAYSKVENTSCQCGCGETQAIYVTAKIKGEWLQQAVGICKECCTN